MKHLELARYLRSLQETRNEPKPLVIEERIVVVRPAPRSFNMAAHKLPKT